MFDFTTNRQLATKQRRIDVGGYSIGSQALAV